MQLGPNCTAVIQFGKSGGKCEASIVFFWNELGLELNSVARSPARANARRRAAGRPPQGGRVAGRPFRRGPRARDARGGTAKTAAEAAFRRRPSASSAGRVPAARGSHPAGQGLPACGAHARAQHPVCSLLTTARAPRGGRRGRSWVRRARRCARGRLPAGRRGARGRRPRLAGPRMQARCELILPWKAPVGESDVY